MRIVCTVLLLVLALSPGVAAREQPEHVWAAPSAKLSQRLSRRLSVTWQRQRLGAALERLSESQQVAIWRDRRVDPNQRFDLRLQDATLSAVLVGVASECKVGLTAIDDVIYVGPVAETAELTTLVFRSRDAVDALPSTPRRRGKKKSSASWPRLSEPRDVVQQWADGFSIELAGIENLPHDLLPAQELPPLAAADLVTLLLAGFDCSLEIDADGLSGRIVPIARPVVMRRQLQIDEAQAAALRSWQASTPRATVSTDSSGTSVTATWDQIAALEHLIGKSTTDTRPRRPRQSPPSEKRFTLRLNDQPVGSVIDQLAAQLNWQVEWQPTSTITKNAMRARRVSVGVENVDEHGLLQAIVAAANLQSSRTGETLTISPQPQSGQ